MNAEDRAPHRDLIAFSLDTLTREAMSISTRSRTALRNSNATIRRDLRGSGPARPRIGRQLQRRHDRQRGSRGLAVQPDLDAQER
jgi:hypothetical protein